MNILDIQPNFWLYWFTFCGIIMGGYFVTAYAYQVLCSALKKVAVAQANSFPINSSRTHSAQAKRTQQRQGAIAEDIKLSILSVIAFALGAACFMLCFRRGYTQIYLDWQTQGFGYLIFSYAVVLLAQDTFFYFMHRLFHVRPLFQWFHRGHHRSRPPTPWTFFAMEPLESFIQAAFLLALTLVLPLHIGVLIAVLLTMSVWAAGNHLGFQVVPDSRLSRQIGKWCIGSTYHLVHHQRYTRHYGLYFTFWDRMLGTQDDSLDGQYPPSKS
ncbi:hypothetical protein C7271_02930 [filamentous cyanobacterium CCP5]|nr:hypothetical protein C7271_02930 [filamentous cyanobacterium CCP5]